MPEGTDPRTDDEDDDQDDDPDWAKSHYPEQYPDGGFQPGSIHRVIMDTRERMTSVEEKVEHTEKMVEEIADEIDELGDEIQTVNEESLDAEKAEKVEKNARFRKIMRRMGAILATSIGLLLAVMGILATLWTGWPL